MNNSTKKKRKAQHKLHQSEKTTLHHSEGQCPSNQFFLHCPSQPHSMKSRGMCPIPQAQVYAGPTVFSTVGEKERSATKLTRSKQASDTAANTTTVHQTHRTSTNQKATTRKLGDVKSPRKWATQHELQSLVNPPKSSTYGSKYSQEIRAVGLAFHWQFAARTT